MMERERLAYELTNFCLVHGILNISCEVEEFAERLNEQFDDMEFIETLINQIIVKTRNYNDLDTGKLIELLVALEYLRLELEYAEPERAKTR